MKEPREIPRFSAFEWRDDSGRYIITRNALGEHECWCTDGPSGEVFDFAETYEKAVAACVAHAETVDERLMLRLVKPSEEAV